MVRKEKFINIRQVGKGGINRFDDIQDIADIELVDAQNMLFDNAAEVRLGSVLKWEKPVGETNNLLCLFDAHTSDGIQYVIAVYAPNFYVRDETNDQWIKISQTYTPSATNKTLMYSYINWNAGRAADSVYACNGTDDFIKWPICLTTLSVATATTDTTVTVTDASYFPASGTLVVQASGGSAYAMPYTSKAGNVFTLTGTAGQIIASGAGVVCEIQDMSSMPKGKVLARHQRRLFVANYYGGEATMKYSNTEAPEDFSTGSGVTKGGALIISDGNGGITLMSDFGQYLIIAKEDSIVHFELTLNASLDAKLDTIYPLVADKSMGPINVWSTIRKNKTTYYPTTTEGILEFNPIATGNSTSVGVEVKSRKIQRLYQELNFENSRTTTYLNKILWSCASNTANDTILVYDVLRDYWTKFNNLDVKDWCLHNDTLLFGSRVDNNIYQTFVENKYTDNDNQYISFIETKDYDFGEASLPKTQTYLFLQGSISSTTTLYIDVTVKKGNEEVTNYYSIQGTGNFVIQPIPEAMAMPMLGTPIMGMGSNLDLDNRGTYRAYLALPIKDGFFVLKFKAYSKSPGDYWSMTGMAFNPELSQQIASGMVADSIANETVTGTIAIGALETEDGDFLIY